MEEKDYLSLPAELQAQRRWCVWVSQQAGNRVAKIPIDPRTMAGADASDPETWVSFSDAITAFRNAEGRLDGLGFFVGDGIFAVDINDALPEAAPLVDQFVEGLNSYAEYDSARTGVHILCKGSVPPGKRQNGNISVYDQAKFIALTGFRRDDAPNLLTNSTEAMAILYRRHIEPRKAPAFVFDKSLTCKLDDEELCEKASSSLGGEEFNLLLHGAWENLYASQGEADLAFCSLLAFWTQKDKAQMDRIFRNSRLMRINWDQTYEDGRTYGEKTLEKALLLCKDVYGLSFNPQSQRYDPKTGEIKSNLQYELNDTGNAERFVKQFGSGIRYNHDNRRWMYWDGQRWANDGSQIVRSKADVMIADMRGEILRVQDRNERAAMLRNVDRLSSYKGKDAMLKEAEHMPGVSVRNSDFDAEDWFINTRSGVVDLRDCSVTQSDRSRMMSKMTGCPVDFSREPARWLLFLSEIFPGSPELIDYIQKAVGYTLTGFTKEQCFFQCYGDGANGKSVFLDVLYEMLGSYASNAQIDALLAQSNVNAGGASSQIARMDGARFIRTNEPNDGSRLNEGLVKQLVSGDTITARFLYGNEFEFRPKGKIWIATNYRLNIRGMDAGIWRRMRLIPFNAKFEGKEADKDLGEKLRRELPQILAWAIKGARKWYEEGLPTPKEIASANDEYKRDMDILGRFVDERLEVGPNLRTSADKVFRAYVAWAKECNEWVMSRTKFGTEMRKRFEKALIGGKTYYAGCALQCERKGYVYEKVDMFDPEEEN